MKNFNNCYAKECFNEINEAIKQNLVIVTDKQNIENPRVCKILADGNYICIAQGYELTGKNDLYQYIYAKAD